MCRSLVLYNVFVVCLDIKTDILYVSFSLWGHYAFSVLNYGFSLSLSQNSKLLMLVGQQHFLFCHSAFYFLNEFFFAFIYIYIYPT